MDCESGDVIKKGNKDARGEEKGRLFREVVGIKKLHLGKVVGRENEATSDHLPQGSASSFLFTE